MNRPNRQMRRRKGKTDAVDAEARAALAGKAKAVPNAADGPVEAIRMLQATRRSAAKARTQAANQIHALSVTAPEPVKHRLAGLRGRHVIEARAQMRPTATAHPAVAAANTALRALARCHRRLDQQIAQLDEELPGLCQKANPALLAARGVGADLRRQRQRQGLTIASAAHTPNIAPTRI